MDKKGGKDDRLFLLLVVSGDTENVWYALGKDMEEAIENTKNIFYESTGIWPTVREV